MTKFRVTKYQYRKFDNSTYDVYALQKRKFFFFWVDVRDSRTNQLVESVNADDVWAYVNRNFLTRKAIK